MTKWNGIGIWNNQVEKPSLNLEIFEMKTGFIIFQQSTSERIGDQKARVFLQMNDWICSYSYLRGFFFIGIYTCTLHLSNTESHAIYIYSKLKKKAYFT